MACNLDTQSVAVVMRRISRDINKRISGDIKTKFNLKEFSKDLFSKIEDPKRPVDALEVIQALPAILHKLIAENEPVRNYFLDNNISRDYYKEDRDFEDLMNVAEYVKILSPIRYEVLKANIDKVNEKKNYNYAKFLEKAQTRTALSSSVLTTSFMPYIPIDPKKGGENVIDQEKVYISNAVKKIIGVVENTDVSEQIVYDGVPIVLRSMPLTRLDPKFLVSYDTDFIEKSPEKAADVLVAVVTDMSGQPVFFNKETSRIEDSKTGETGIVYQELYKIKKTKEGFEILNRSNNPTAVMSPKTLAQKEFDDIIKSQNLSDFEILKWRKEEGNLIFKKLITQAERRFQWQLTGLFNLQNKTLRYPNEKYLINITSGTYGTVQKNNFPLSSTRFEINGPLLPAAIVGEEKGYVRIPVKNTETGDTQNVRLQRGNIDDTLIEKVADVITTTAKLKGSQLTRLQRQRYADIMVTGVPGNQISVFLSSQNSVEQLTLKLGTKYYTEDEIFTEETRQDIINHLKDVVKLDNGDTLSANINIHSASIGQDIIDYEIDGNIITDKSINYNTFVKPYLLIEISEASGQAWGARNPQFGFVVPENIQNDITESSDINSVDETIVNTRYELTEDTKIGEINPVFKRGPKIATLNRNLNQSDVVLNISFDNNKKDEATWAFKNANPEKLIPIKLGKNKKVTQVTANNIAKQINDKNGSVINITGNNLFGIRQASSWYQKDIDAFMLDLLSKVYVEIEASDNDLVILTTGETGVSEAAIKAAKALKITTEITIPNTYDITSARIQNKKLTPITKKGKDAFLERFEDEARTRKKGTKSQPKKKAKPKTNSKTYTRKTKYYKSKTISKKGKGKKKTNSKGKKVSGLTQEQMIKARQELDATLKKSAENRKKRNLFDEDDGLERSKEVGSFFDKIFTTKSQKDKARKWFNTESNLAGVIPLEVITEVVNSNAFATWSKYGIILYEGDGGTSVDLYHEAWHGFSQLFLTRSEKEDLYSSIKRIPKYNKLNDESVEEKLAEEFRTYGKRQSTTLGKIAESIFARMREFFQRFFGFGGRINYLKLRDLPNVKSLFDKLYKGEILDLQPSIDNIIFSKLNRSKTIQLTKREEDNYNDFTVDESNKALNTMDNITASIIRDQLSGQQSPAIKKVLENVSTQNKLYNAVYEDLIERRDQYDDVLNNMTIKNSEDQFQFEELFAKVNLLNKILNNYGDPELALTGKQKTGVVAYHIQSSRFANIKEIFEDEITDEGQQLAEETQSIQDMEQYKDDKINNFDPKKLASQDTMNMLSLIPKLEKNNKGEFDYIIDEFGFEQLENIDLMWNRISKVLEGSEDFAEMHKRLVDNSLNYPQFLTVLQILRSPGEDYISNVQFSQETNFVQDLSKPRVPFRQLNILKNIVQRGDSLEKIPEIIEYSLGVANASFSTKNVEMDWKAGFLMSTPEVNKYITIESGLNNPMLDLAKIVDKVDGKAPFEINGRFNENKSLEFLAAIGLPMDTTSYEIQAIASKDLAFAKAFQLPLIYETIKQVRQKLKSPNVDVQAAAQSFAMDPINSIMKPLNKKLRTKELKSTDVANRVRLLAQLQVAYSDKFSNFSTTLPTNDRVWEQQYASTITKHLTAINNAENWQQLTGGKDGQADPTGKYKHMYWLSEANNTYPTYSKLLNSVFYLEGGVEKQGSRYGTKRTILKHGESSPVKLLAFNVGGTKQVDQSNYKDTFGAKTSSSDVTSKFLQELNTMLLAGVEEFMRHASKNTSMGITAEQINTSTNKKTKFLYIDVEAFRGVGNAGVVEGLNIMEGYLFGELQRMFRYTKNKSKTDLGNPVALEDIPGYSRKTLKKDSANPTEFIDAGSAFTAFSDVLSNETQGVLYRLIDSVIKTDGELNLEEIFTDNSDLRSMVRSDITNYFEKLSDNNYKRYEKAGYLSKDLEDLIKLGEGYTQEQLATKLIDAYTWNSWIHKFETTIVGYGDVVQYNHAKEEFHKRNPFLATGAKTLRADSDAIQYVNTKLKFKLMEKLGFDMPNYNGTFDTAILKEKIIPKSEYYDEYFKALVDFYTPKFKSKAKAEEVAKDRLDAYLNIEEGDGQGFIPLEFYRLMQDLVGEWSSAQEALYNQIVNDEVINAEDITEMFPPLKYQYSGNIESKVLPVVSLHKFSLAPLIPGMMGNSNLQKLHDSMMRNGIAYSTYQTGSKVNQMGNGDAILDSDNNFNDSMLYSLDGSYTKNTIYATYLKSQINVNKNFKGVNPFSTQMRKLILEGLYERGIIKDKRAEALANKYIKDLGQYTDLVTYEFLEEIGFYQDGDKFFMKNKESLTNLLELVRNSLQQQDVIGDHLIDIIDVTNNNNLSLDLSLHPAAKRIEKLILSQISKRIIKQKFNGEPLVQQTSSLMEGLFEEPVSKFKKASKEYIKKLKGSNFLPTYHQSKKMIDGKMQDVTAASKVVITLQGDFVNLLNLEYEGEVIGTIDRLNELVKDDDFVDQHRDQLSMVGVRIPVQGLNSMEFMEIYHFLPPGNANVLISASELVAKSGGDFDVDKLTTYMPNINTEGLLKKSSFSLEEIKVLKSEGLSENEIYDIIQYEKGALQNDILLDLRNILELPQNFVSLITPNSTSLLTPIAEELAEYVMEYNPKENLMSASRDYVLDKYGTKKEVISPTRIFEAEYNLYKHESNNIGKRTLGLGAVENTFNTLMTSLGAFMPNTFTHGRGASAHTRSSVLFLPHNKMLINNKTGKEAKRKSDNTSEVISISDIEDVNGINRIGDVISQMINGWVDVEKDAWIFFIQGNYEVAPQLLYLIKAGVPVKEAVYFVSNPLVREYVRQQQLAKSTFADPLKTRPKNPQFGVKYPAATAVLKNLDSVIAEPWKTLSTNAKRYKEGVNRSLDYFNETRNEKGEFTLDEMTDLIQTDPAKLNLKQQKLAAVMFLHYLSIEQQIDALTQLKINMNPDTRSKTGGAVIEQSELKIEELGYNDKLMPGLIDKFKNDSVIGSYFKNDLGAKILEEIFPLRYNKIFVQYMQSIDQDLQNYSMQKYGKRDMEAISSFFRDEFVNYIFQNVARRLDVGDGYTNYKLNRNYKPKKTIELKFGAFVKNGQMYIDEKALKKEFREGKWKATDKSEGNYESRGLFPLAPGTFVNKETNFNQYLNFVLERETLRSLKNKSEVEASPRFESEYKITRSVKPKLSVDEAKRYTYERMLAHEALENILNPYQLFGDPKYAFAIQLKQMMMKYEKELSKFDVVDILGSEQSRLDGKHYMFTKEKDYTTRISNLYRSQLEDLANPLVKKVSNMDENRRLSDLFSKLNLIGFLQTGVSASKYNVTNLLDPADYLFMVQAKSNEFNKELKSGNTGQILQNLDKFKEVFERLNIENKRQFVFKDYTVKEDILDIAKKESRKEKPKEIYLTPSPVDGVEFYNSSSNKVDYYEKLANENPDKMFVYGYFLGNVKSTKPTPYRSQGLLRMSADEMSIGLPIGERSYIDNFEDFAPARYSELMKLWDRKFNEIDELIKDGVTVVFPKEGLGGLKMPSELFVYLSNKLVNYGLLNPGSVQYQDVQETLGNVQGITDAEIIEELGLEEDPFVCPT